MVTRVADQKLFQGVIIHPGCLYSYCSIFLFLGTIRRTLHKDRLKDICHVSSHVSNAVRSNSRRPESVWFSITL